MDAPALAKGAVGGDERSVRADSDGKIQAVVQGVLDLGGKRDRLGEQFAVGG